MAIYSNDQYFEGKIQIRPNDEEVIKVLKKLIDQRNDILIAKEVQQKTGMDYYITSNRAAASIGKQLKKRFKGELKITKKLFGQDRLTSKKLWRVTVLFRRAPLPEAI